MIRTLKCPICGTTFESDKNAKIYCSIKCRRKASIQAAKINKESEIYHCKWCGSEFKGRKKMYCSTACQKAANGRERWRKLGSKLPYDGLTLEQVQRICIKENISYGEYTKRKYFEKQKGA